MAWSVELTETAQKQLKKLDRKWQATILDYLEDEITLLENPRARGKALVGDKKGFWRYRVGDYRIVCQIRDTERVIMAVTIGHQKKYSRYEFYRFEGSVECSAEAGTWRRLFEPSL